MSHVISILRSSFKTTETTETTETVHCYNIAFPGSAHLTHSTVSTRFGATPHGLMTSFRSVPATNLMFLFYDPGIYNHHLTTSKYAFGYNAGKLGQKSKPMSAGYDVVRSQICEGTTE